MTLKLSKEKLQWRRGKKMIKGVLFDLDGVIVETDAFHYIAWKKIAQKLTIDIDETFNEQLKGVSRAESLRRILQLKQMTLTPSAFNAAMVEKNNYYLQLIENMTAQDCLPGIKDFLQSLRDKGVKVALASVSRNGPTILEKIGLKTMFDYIADPGKVPSKPDPGIFLLAAEGLALFPEECVGIEDSEAGVEAIKKAGMIAIGIGTNLVKADVQLKNTRDLSLTLLHQLA